jgi:lysophospholipase L1-like esterase
VTEGFTTSPAIRSATSRRARFPYALAALKALLAPAFWVPALDQIMIGLGIPQHRVFYSLPGIRGDLRALYERFAAFARAHDIRPVIVFIPAYEQDRVSGLLGIAAATDEQRAQIVFVNVGSDFDWSRFFRGCHPSADGYAMIAANVADALRPLLTTAH